LKNGLEEQNVNSTRNKANSITIICNFLDARLAKILQHCRPSLGHNFAGRHGQPFALPRVVADAVGGRVVEPHFGQLRVVQDAGDETTRARDRNFVVEL
jgi:hypothetical protein